MYRVALLKPTLPLSILVPVYNETESLPGLLGEIADALASREEGFELLLVDDGSTDGGIETLVELVPQLPQLRTLRHARRCGKSAALRSGARAARGEIIITLDGDGQDDPAEIPRLLGAFAADDNLALLAGVRIHRHDSATRRWASRSANAFRGMLLRDDCPDSACGLKLFRRERFLELPFFSGMHRFLPALFQLQGGRTACIEVHHRPRRFGISKYRNFGRGVVGFVDLLGVLWLKRRTPPPCAAAEPKRGRGSGHEAP